MRPYGDFPHGQGGDRGALSHLQRTLQAPVDPRRPVRDAGRCADDLAITHHRPSAAITGLAVCTRSGPCIVPETDGASDAASQAVAA